MKELNSKNELNELLNANSPILLDFYADWCGPCQTLLPIVESLAEEHKDDFVIAKVNVDKNEELTKDFQVRNIPALFLIKNQEVKEKLVGLQTKEHLNNIIQQYA